MKQTIAAAVICLLMSLIPIQPTDTTLNILYGIIGVLFSVGMSLIIAFNGSNIVNPELKAQLRDNMHNVRNNFLFVFLVCSMFYIGFSLLKTEWQKIDVVKTEDLHIYCTWATSVLTMLIYSIIALISNYVQIQQFYEDIEDKIHEEQLSKKGK